jgi:hemolysin III
MITRTCEPLRYTRAELLSDAAVHVLGIAASLVALPVLVWLAIGWAGDARTVAALVIYGVSVLVLFVCSALNNMLRRPAWKERLRRLDQSAIYVKIAGSYTPFAVLAGSHAGLFLAGLWGMALAGASMRLLSGARLKWASIALYLLMGWAGAFFGGPLVEALSPEGALLIVVAGLTYTLGVVFFVWEGLPFHNTIWHVFVLAGTCVLYAAVVVELSGRAAA